MGLSAAGNSFYTLFAQAGGSAANPSDIWFRDPPPAPGDDSTAGGVTSSTPASDETAPEALGTADAGPATASAGAGAVYLPPAGGSPGWGNGGDTAGTGGGPAAPPTGSAEPLAGLPADTSASPTFSFLAADGPTSDSTAGFGDSSGVWVD
jgi:hypothetical protein